MATIYKIVDRETNEEVNFYDASLEGAKHWALDCKRHMKSMTGKEYDVIVKYDDGSEVNLKEHEKSMKESGS